MPAFNGVSCPFVSHVSPGLRSRRSGAYPFISQPWRCEMRATKTAVRIQVRANGLRYRGSPRTGAVFHRCGYELPGISKARAKRAWGNDGLEVADVGGR